VKVVVSLKDKALLAKTPEIYRDMARLFLKSGLLRPDWPDGERR
jgi:hypothetical protein